MLRKDTVGILPLAFEAIVGSLVQAMYAKGASAMDTSVLSYRVDILSKLAPVFEPLAGELGISTFGYRIFFSNGKSFGICSNEKWNSFFEYQFLSQNKHIPRYEEEVGQALKKGKYFWARIGEPDSNDRFCSMLYEFDVWNSLCIYYKNSETVDAFYFASTKDNKDIINFYLNNIKLLERYASYFKEKFSEITNIENLAKLSEPTLGNGVFANGCSGGEDEEIRVKNFSQSLPVSKLVMNKEGQSIILSKREAECLCYMAFGKTMKEIAICLNLSPRTIEFYIDNMKKKTGLSSKSQLLSMFFNSLTEWPIKEADL